MTPKRKQMCITCIYRCKDIKPGHGEHMCHEDQFGGIGIENAEAAICAGSSRRKGSVFSVPKFREYWDRWYSGEVWCFEKNRMVKSVDQFYDIIIQSMAGNGKNSHPV